MRRRGEIGDEATGGRPPKGKDRGIEMGEAKGREIQAHLIQINLIPLRPYVQNA